MADGFTVTVQGGQRLRRQLAALEDAVAAEILEIAVASGALLVANRAKQLAAFKTGTLRRSIHVGGHTDLTPDYEQRAGKGPQLYGPIGGNRNTRSSAEVVVGTNVPYARRIEYGFAGKDKLGRTYNQPAQPYLRPAFDETRDDVVKEIGEAIEDQLTRVARRVR